PGRTILRSQPRVCLPDFNPNTGTDAKVCNDPSSAPLMPVGTESLPATRPAFARTSGFTTVLGTVPSPALDACANNGGELHVDLTNNQLSCVLCDDTSLKCSPADRVCGACPDGATTIGVPARIPDPKTARITCLSCPPVTPDSDGTQKYFLFADD